MSGRAYVVILFFWAVLTIITPMLIRLSESAKPTLHFNVNFSCIAGERREGTNAGIQRLLPRRALVVPTVPPQALAPPPSPAPAPVPAPAPSPMSKQWYRIKKAYGTMTPGIELSSSSFRVNEIAARLKRL
ncbi:hypothetical protein HYC85_020659 [Camellia sinensis]|uniref:Uncharacterized protein n=1 Tax=Camellia sinensis TaxID=4442 RepID=A0A7J7GRE3_CAMSI|nr:hypothetical protein HYC85_020659 [Camellia sinensis]